MLNIRLNFRQLRFYSNVSRKILEEAQEKVVKVSIIGLPNSGKSTLINAILNGQKVCPTSDKVHTTTSFAQAITNRQSSQIIVFDTPGLVTKQEMKKHKLDEKFISSCRHSIQNSNLIGVLHDVSNFWTRGQLHPIVLDLLKEFDKKSSFLILNKIDKLKSKRSLLDVVKVLTCNNLALDIKTKGKHVDVEEITNKDQEREKKVDVGWPHFKAVFMVSSLNGDGVEKVVEFIESQSIPTPWVYKNNEITDRSPTELIEEFVRARLLDYLPQEIPYQLSTELEYFSAQNNKIFASVNVYCPSSRIEKLVCGIGDGKLRQITDRVTSDLIQSFKLPVTLTLVTSVRKKSG